MHRGHRWRANIHLANTAMKKEQIPLRDIEGSHIFDVLNCAYISRRFFNKSRSWFTQRLNNNTVNGEKAFFTPEELSKLQSSLDTISKEITQFANKLPKTPKSMITQVYIISDPTAIEFLQKDDIEGFKQYLSEDKTLHFDKPQNFYSEEEALAFCAGLTYGKDDNHPVKHYPLVSCKQSDSEYIDAVSFYPNPAPQRKSIFRPEIPGEPKTVYEITDVEFFCTYVNGQFEEFCNLIKNGECGKIYKNQFDTIDEAEHYGNYLIFELDHFPLNDYQIDTEPYVEVIEKYKCYE